MKVYTTIAILIVLLAPVRIVEIQNEPYNQQTEELINKIITCESNWNTEAVGDNGKAYGLAQFHYNTWLWLNDLYGTNLNYYDPNDQIELLRRAINDNRAYLWSCYKL